MARKVYMVDTENVSSSWRMMLADMTRNDVLYLFYTEHSPGIGYADFKEIMESETKPELISCYPGKNGLDFQLVSYLGYLLKSAGKTEYIIISNDMGYDCVIHFWTEQGYKVSRMTVYDLIQRKKARLAMEEIPQALEKTTVKETTDISVKGQISKEQSSKENTEKVIVKENNTDTTKLGKQNMDDQIQESNTDLQKKIEATLPETNVIEQNNIELESTQKSISTVSMQIVIPKEKEIQVKRGRRKKQPEEEKAYLNSENIENIIETKVEEETKYKEQEIEDESGDGKKLLTDLLASHDVDMDTVIEILRHGSPHQLQKVYTQMLKLFGHQTGVELYHVLKPHFPVLFTYAKNGLEHGIDI